MKLIEKVKISISIVALLLSIYAVVANRVESRAARQAAHRLHVYDAYHLGKAAAAIYAYARSDNKRPTAEGMTQDRAANMEITAWTIAAQGYAQSFHVSPGRFVAFRNLLVTSTPDSITTAFDSLDASLSQQRDPSIQPAYELGWQTILIRIGLQDKSSQSGMLKQYRTIRAMIDERLNELDIKWKMPGTVRDAHSYISAISHVIKILDAMRPE